MKKTATFILALMMSTIFLAGCSDIQQEMEPEKSSTVEQAVPDVRETVGWVNVGTVVTRGKKHGDYIFSGFTSKDTFMITHMRFGAYLSVPVPYHYPAREGMQISIGESDIKMTLLKADRENNRVQIKLERKSEE